jgi:hypothetical protein
VCDSDDLDMAVVHAVDNEDGNPLSDQLYDSIELASKAPAARE